MQLPPIVYAGPSIAAEGIHEILPDAVIMPPVKRGDLYRDRMLGFSYFLILDGVFYHELAIPPREILDVMADGAMLVGATSMGAIRAAECWPAGMRGIGTIYRLFRRGSLRSDDEVAVAFGPVNPHLISTVPLVNVRYAVSRAIRAGEIEQSHAEKIILVAESTFYTARNWRSILLQAGQEDKDGQLRQCLMKYDLKHIDSIRALRVTAALLARDPSLMELSRLTNAPFEPNQANRERGHDPFRTAGIAISKPDLWGWLLASGRIRRYSMLAGWYEKNTTGMTAPEFPERAWLDLKDLGELESLAYHYRAISEAAEESRKEGLLPGAEHLYQAEVEIAVEHGFPDWNAMKMELSTHEPFWQQIRDYRELLSLAKCFRAGLFKTTHN